jgi:hypothetical protein
LAGGIPSARTEHRPRTRTEFIESCRNLIQDELERAAGVKAAAELLDDLPSAWRDGPVLCTFGDAFAHYGDFERAADLYRKAVTDSGAEAPISAVQKLANFLDRHAKTLNLNAAKLQTPAEKDELESKAQEQVTEAIKRLKWLRELGETVERWSLLGGAYRRMALFKATEENLRIARDCYKNGHDLALATKGEINPYPALNWISLRFLIGEKPADLEPELALIMKAAVDQAAGRTDFWSQIGYPDSLLVGSIICGTLNREKNKIIKAYGVLLRESKNQARIEAVYGGASDMRDLVMDTSRRDDLSQIAASIHDIKETT